MAGIFKAYDIRGVYPTDLNTAMAEAIAELDMAAFIMDYDHNAPSPEHLQKTHAEFFRIIRKAHPKLPILILTRGDSPSPKRTAVIRETYDKAVKAGDKVKTGDVLGHVAVNADGTQLHFQLWKGREPQDPEKWLR